MKDQEHDQHDSAYRTGPPRERTGLRDHLESLAIAILLVLLVRQLGVEAFRIRHGSMAPTLLGSHLELRCPNCSHVFEVGDDKQVAGLVECDNCHFDWQVDMDTSEVPRATMLANQQVRGAARVFVNKFIYHLRDPRRWDVVVFRVDMLTKEAAGQPVRTASDHLTYGEDYSNEAPQNYIKRVVGLPGETIDLRDGDVYVNGAIARKPPAVQKQLWMHVYDSFYPPDRAQDRIWQTDSATEAWHAAVDGGRLVVDALELPAPTFTSYVPQIRDYYAYDGPGFGDVSGHNLVGDCRIRATVRPENALDDGAVFLRVKDAGHEFTVRFDCRPGGVTELRQDGEVVAESSFGLPVGESSELVLENYDDRLVVRMNGKELLRYDYDPVSSPLTAFGVPELGRRGVSFGAAGARVVWERLRLDRDIYWVSEREETFGHRPGPYKLAEDEYFVLGDNSPASSDSRSVNWARPGVSRSHIVGQTFFVFWPVHVIKWLQGGSRAADEDD